MTVSRIRIEPIAESLEPSFDEPLGFGRRFTDRMFTQRYSAAEGWSAPTIGPYRDLVMDPAAAALHSGQMVFDGAKAYRRPDGNLNLFRIDRNVERFNTSALRMGMPVVDPDLHVSAIETLVDEVIAANQQQVADYLGGKQKAFNSLVGQVMKASKGKANPAQVNKILKSKLDAD